MKIPAVVLAGGELEKSLEERFDSRSKAFITIRGKMMVEYVMDALENAPSVGEKIISAPDGKIPPEIEKKFDGIARSGENILMSMKNGIEMIEPAPARVLVVPCDAPLLTPDSIEDFISRCEKSEGDLFYSFLPRKISEEKYPGFKHTYVKLREGIFCGGSLFLINPAVIEAARKLFERVIAARKKPWRIATLLGLKIIFKFSQGILTVKDLEEKVSQLLGYRAAGIETSYPEVGINIDSAEQYDRVLEILKEEHQ